jgi:hypothetical protein
MVKQQYRVQPMNRPGSRKSGDYMAIPLCTAKTKFDRYLKQAKHIADFLIHHKNLPKDKIPYWDYNAKDIPNQSAMLQLQP